jgi:hypothetical protein
MNKNSMSLVSLLKESPDYMTRISEIAEEVKKDKTKILKMADTYNDKYKKEISEGTIQRQILITEGAKSGKTPEESVRISGRFIPSIHTPILNWLYFFMREDTATSADLLTDEQRERYKHLLHENQDIKEMDKVPEAFVFLSGKITNEQFQKLKKLKKLAVSNTNEHESNSAYRKCLELCEFFEVDFNKIQV